MPPGRGPNRSVFAVPAMLSTLGRPVAIRAFAVMASLGIPAFVVFSPNGLSARELVLLVHRSWWIRGFLWAGWVLIATPAMRAIFEAHGTTTLRSLRLPAAPLVLTLALLATLVQLPWLILFARGAGPLAAASAFACAVSLQCSIQIAVRRPKYTVVALALAFAVLVDVPGTWTLAIGCAGAPWCLLRAWRLAPERSIRGIRSLTPTTPLLALYGTHLLRLTRSERPRLIASALLTAAGALAVCAGFQNDPEERSLARALAILTMPLAAATAICVAPLLECEAGLQPRLRASRVRRRTIAAAFLFALGTPASAFAASAGAITTVACPGFHVAAPLTFSSWAAALALPIGIWGRRHEQLKHPSTSKFVAGVLLVALSALVVLSAW